MSENNYDINNFVVLCDENGNILQVISKGQFEKNIHLKNNLCEFISKESITKFFDFLQRIKAEGYIADYEIKFKFNNNDLHMSLSGVCEADRILIIALYPNPELNEILKDVLRINSLYITQLRSKIKNSYLNESNLDEKVYLEISRLNNELINSKRVIEQQNAQLIEYAKSLENLALIDSLTGAYNRTQFNIKISEEIREIKKSKSCLVLTAIDLDHFKIVNDRLGHSAGDELLQKFVQICNRILRKDLDLVFRIGGDEFVIISLHINKEKVLEIVKEIDESFKKYTDISELSYGIIEIVSDQIDNDFSIDSYLKVADENMYLFKRNKRKSVFYN